MDLEKTYDKISTGLISLSFGKKTKEETLQDVKNLMVLQKETLISSEYAKYLEHKENYKVALQQVLRMANEVISEERETYKILYKNSKSTKRNPCKEIFL